jgi:hypothetical protein
MIKLLANFFRAFHLIVGISLPPPSVSDGRFVLWWVGGISVISGLFALMFYIVLRLNFRH